MTELIDGIGINVSPSAPKRACSTRGFPSSSREGANSSTSRMLEPQLESFIEAKPYTRAAAKRYLIPKVVTAVSEAHVLLRRAKAVLEKYEGPRPGDDA